MIIVTELDKLPVAELKDAAVLQRLNSKLDQVIEVGLKYSASIPKYRASIERRI